MNLFLVQIYVFQITECNVFESIFHSNKVEAGRDTAAVHLQQQIDEGPAGLADDPINGPRRSYRGEKMSTLLQESSP